MIKIKVVTDKDNKMSSIFIKGHAMYDDFGKDIVCAGVSATILCTINAINKIISHTIDYKIGEGTAVINIVEQKELTYQLLENMLNCLKNLEQQYPNNIKIKEEK